MGCYAAGRQTFFDCVKMSDKHKNVEHKNHTRIPYQDSEGNEGIKRNDTRERGRRKEEIINDQLEGDSGKKRGGGGEMDCGVHARLPCHAMPCGGGGGGAPACPPGGPGWTYLCHVRQTAAAAATCVSKPIQGYP